MERPRIIRFLRIGWTGLFVVFCLLLIGLWVRSYWFNDFGNLHYTGDDTLAATSIYGRVIFSQITVSARLAPFLRGNNPKTLEAGSHLISESRKDMSEEEFVRRTDLPRFPGFSIKTIQTGRGVRLVVPHWFLVQIALVLTALPWLPWSISFSLRTLLIATTVVAVVLGIVAVAIR